MWLLSLALVLLLQLSAAQNVSYDHRSLILNGKRRILLSGSVHYPRATPEMWPGIIQKAKEGGLDVIETYVFWDRHEPSPGQYYFEGRYDLVKFVKLVQQAGLLMNLRIGPYVCAEWNLGGFPIWLRDIPHIVFRTDNEPFKKYMQSFLTKIVNMMKEENLFASQGGPIILAQVENEYGNVDSHYGEAGVRYINWAAEMAQAQNTGVPWIMCAQSKVPEYIIDTCNGMYCDGWNPILYKKPTMWTESYTGWFTYYGWPIPHRPVEDIAFAVARFFERGGSFHNYYMYFGGTNFGRTSGGPYVASSYDYDAPLDEYGMQHLPKWGHLKDLHETLKLGEEVILSSEGQHSELGPNQEAHVYSYGNGCVAFLANVDSMNDTVVEFRNVSYSLPAWSVSILLDCKTVAFNSAKVKSQSAVVSMSPSKSTLSWTSFDEPVGISGSSFKAKQLLEQMETTKDTSDYLWYTTSVEATGTGSTWLSIESMRDVVHIFVNGQFQSSWHTSKSVLYNSVEAPITLAPGSNTIALLSATVGLQNFGAFIETWSAGLSGSLILKGLPGGDQNLSKQEWTYQVGLKGEDLKLFTVEGSRSVNWSAVSTEKPLTWYMTEFDAPPGDDPVALDLASMGKGQAWVNGQSIGRYWPAYKAADSVCPESCDYRGSYDQNKCLTGCGQSSQRWYHVPRSWMKPRGNLLVLFEETGGDPSSIDFVTRSTNVICARVYESHPASVKLWCPGEKQVISQIRFASLGNPEGSCGSFKEGSCHTNDLSNTVEKACVGQRSCSLAPDFTISACPGVREKFLAVEALCSS
ncbi:beta-galactosidase 8 [Selaginella moellendorffii]|uniref:beta-galactosidase 8 n=1 Tax=Selaginella moellendorffii TaxID=88036 RepID=UPI000D1C7932|nr:beta-galactosidase 8 [Selaginella moellendorffii]|eukprot:XP_024534038.1 beta-galactosidase 8 [Selaginella moellendorffii]